MKRQNILLLVGAIALAVVPLVMIGHGGGGAFGGSDDLATKLITAIEPGYHRWVSPVWEPPSGEIESLLFAVQASLGTGVVAYCLGYYRGRRRAQADHAATR
jgi:cobalt/nickel transport protein